MPSPIKDRDQVRQLVNIDLPSASKTKVLEIITESGAILDGHFSFGYYHSQHFLRFRGIGNSSRHPIEYCEYLASLLLKSANINTDTETPLKILSAETSGLFLGSAVARLLSDSKKNELKNLVLAPVDGYRLPDIRGGLRSGQINPGDRVAVVSDVDHTGESLDRLIKLARRKGAVVDIVMVFATCHDAGYAQRMIDMGVKPY